MHDTLLKTPFPSTFSIPKPNFPSLSRPRNLSFSTFPSKQTPISLPPKPPKPEPQTQLEILSPGLAPNTDDEFQEKMLYLDSIGIDIFSVIADHPPIVSASLSDIKATVDFITSTGFTAVEFCRIVAMCPEVLSSRLADVIPVFTFLLREAGVNGSDLKRVINGRPRLLACSVKHRLRPTMYFLQTIGILEVKKHTPLLSCSVEDKLLPKIEYFENLGLSHREALTMFRRFPQLFCLSVKDCYEPKFKYAVVEMGRSLKEVSDFPQYFSFSLENRIKPRHQSCVEHGVCFTLPVLLKTSESRFRRKLEVSCSSPRCRNTNVLSQSSLTRSGACISHSCGSFSFSFPALS